MRIKEVVVFAYATRGEALEIANKTVEDTLVAECNIVTKDGPAKTSVCFIVVPTKRPLVKE